MHFFSADWYKFALNSAYLAYKCLKFYAETAPTNGDIWDEFSDQQ